MTEIGKKINRDITFVEFQHLFGFKVNSMNTAIGYGAIYHNWQKGLWPCKYYFEEPPDEKFHCPYCYMEHRPDGKFFDNRERVREVFGV